MTLSKDSEFLNFVYLTAAFHDFVINSNKSFEEAIQNPIYKKRKILKLFLMREQVKRVI